MKTIKEIFVLHEQQDQGSSYKANTAQDFETLQGALHAGMDEAVMQHNDAQYEYHMPRQIEINGTDVDVDFPKYRVTHPDDLESWTECADDKQLFKWWYEHGGHIDLLEIEGGCVNCKKEIKEYNETYVDTGSSLLSITRYDLDDYDYIPALQLLYDEKGYQNVSDEYIDNNDRFDISLSSRLINEKASQTENRSINMIITIFDKLLNREFESDDKSATYYEI